ncbi:MAG: hypothetical protein ABWZ40_05965 [Caulobacterales bacterium]
MSSEALWSVKGIDPRARDAAREAARRAGMSLGDWLNRVILVDDEAPPQSAIINPAMNHARRSDPFHGADATFEARPSEVSSTIHSLDRLAERIETAEARSALAITGIDQSVYALVARLDNAERGQRHYNTKLEGGLRELRATQTAVADRLRRMEESGFSNHEDAEALRSLETALSTLATRVREVEEGAISKAHVDLKLSAIAQKVDLATNEMERISERTEEVAVAAFTVTSDMSDNVKDLAERLTQAETATDAAVRALYATVSDLGDRLADAEAREDVSVDAMDGRLSSVTDTVTRMIDAGREEVAREIAAAFAMLKPGETEATLTDLQSRLAAAERRQLASFERIGSEIDRLAQSLDQRLRGLEERNSHGEGASDVMREEMARVVDAMDKRVQAVADRDMAAIQRMGDEMARFAGAMEERLAGSEKITAEAIMQVGEKIEDVAERLHDRQQHAIDELVQKMRDQDTAADERLDAALTHVTQRLEKVERNVEHSPLHSALEALSSRLANVESGAPAKVLPSSFEGPSAKNSTEPRVSGWGVYDATPAIVPAPVLDDEVHAEGEEIILSSVLDDAGDDRPPEVSYEPLDILDAEDFPSANEVKPETAATEPPAWAIETADDEAAEEPDDLAALIEMLEAASGAIPANEEAADAEEQAIIEAVAAPQEEIADEDDIFDLPAMAALNFARPEPATDISCGADDEELLLTAQDAPEHSIDPDDILDLDPELEEAIFGVRRAKALADLTPEPQPETIEPPADAPVETDFYIDTDSFSSMLDDRLAIQDLSESALVDDAAPEIVARPPVDYLQQARMAAMASHSVPKGPVRGRSLPSSGGGALTSAHLLTAAGVAAVAAIGAGTYFSNQLDSDNLEQSFSQNAPSLGAAHAAVKTPATETPSAADAASQDFAALEQKPRTNDPYPEALPTAPPAGMKEGAPELAMATASAPNAAIAGKPADAALTYQRALDSLRGGDANAGAAAMKQAADQGYAPAQYRLSKLYERGEGVPKNMSEARRWTEKSAKAGNRKAMHDLAVYYAEGEGVRQDYVSAVEWFRKAADYGLSDSQYNLGVLYEQGLGVTQDQGEALYWFEVAGRGGDQDAARRARELEATAPPAVVSATLRRVDVFQPRAADPLANADSKRSAPNVSYMTGN